MINVNHFFKVLVRVHFLFEYIHLNQNFRADSGNLVVQKDLGYTEVSAHEKVKDDETIDERAEITLEDKLVNHEPLPYANKLVHGTHLLFSELIPRVFCSWKCQF